jgi:predicted dehydrogenase
MAMKRRVAVAGLGSIGRRHTRLLLERHDVSVELVETNAETLAAVQREFGPLISYTSFEAMIETRPDVVWIATPTPLHTGQAVRALEAGAHVFCEKPMSASFEDALRMKAAADGATTVLNIGFYLHFSSILTRLKALIEDGALGNVIHAHARVGSYATLGNSISRYQAEVPGSLFFDYSHQPDLFYWLLHATPASVWVVGFQGGELELTSAPNVVDIVCEYPCKLVTTIHLNYVQMPERHEYEVAGDQGWAVVDFLSGSLRTGSRADGKTTVEMFHQERDDIFRGEHRAFFEAVDGKCSPETSAAEGLVSTAICEAAIESWRSQQRVRVRINHES